MDTGLGELEGFFEGEGGGGRQEFAVITDGERRFVLGVATRGDLEEFVRRRGGDGRGGDARQGEHGAAAAS